MVDLYNPLSKIPKFLTSSLIILSASNSVSMDSQGLIEG